MKKVECFLIDLFFFMLLLWVLATKATKYIAKTGVDE